jgi:putative CocE/NonD family hydrolase
MPEMGTAGIRDRSTVDEREDVLVYDSPRLTEPLSIAGPVAATLHASSSARDTDFTATLTDVGPDGYCMPVAEGILRTRYRNGTSDSEPLSPEEIYELDIDLWAVAHTFEPNHRIRLSISSSNFPRFDPHPNVYEPLADVTADEVRTATQRVYHDENRPSSLSLPVIDNGLSGDVSRTTQS